MEIVGGLRLLWAHRLLVLAGLVGAVAVGVLAGARSVPPGALAKTRVVVDTPRSQLVTDAPRGADSLSWRASMLTIYAATDGVRATIAGRAGVPVSRLAVVDRGLAAPIVPASLPRAAAQAAEPDGPFVVNLVADGVLPVVEIAAVAPGRAAAARLAQATADVLRASARRRGSEVQARAITQAGPVRVSTIPGGSGLARMAAIALGVFGLWSTCLLLVLLAGRAGRRLPRAPRAA